ncbi:allantoate amidohydrolase [Methylobacterium frigidaeris]|uniref:N-carbamoyl-L-amino acid hydrolase n=1 Tax=Methylobacterium frigidaeris TaxID=2038277 RepID=A0AA37H7M1_9HYPH|nr:allantoate amidohydrolase [Methylobacterium frigidaeris]PIK70394.1 allantoate amidohydrolase [Methylobacterium frigidaeris]GJD60439.1 N-carbamoyl-L-amino acid hydrolase [Methylobacterium frigidaeris]
MQHDRPLNDTSLGAAVMAQLDALARFSADAEGLTRLYLTPAHADAARQVAAWMEEAGMTTRLDAAATVIGRYEAATPGAPTLLLGSHIDTVRHAGRYDGNLGVVTAIAAVKQLHEAGERLPFAIEVLAFGDEEGVRFPVTLTGSRALAGLVRPEVLAARDGDGVSLAQALRDFGGDPDGVARLARDPASVLGYLEVHIEQGPVLEEADLPVGIVTAIAGASRLVVTVEGRAGHAGTVPMALRHDALAAAAEMVLAIESEAKGTPDLVATVGQIEVPRGAVNVIPALTRFTLDLRSPSDAVRHAALARLRAAFAATAERRGVAVSAQATYDEPAASCAPGLMHAIADGIARLGFRPLHLASGAGHDGLALAGLCPIGMIFVRCAGGLSHSPAESVTTEDVDAATRLLVDVLRHLRPESLARPSLEGPVPLPHQPGETP